MILQRLLRDSFFYTVPMALSRVVSLLMLPVYSRFLSPDSYGHLDLFLLIATLLNLVLTLEVYQGVARYYSDGDAAFGSSIASTGLFFAVLCNIVFFLTAAASYQFLADYYLADFIHFIDFIVFLIFNFSFSVFSILHLQCRLSFMRAEFIGLGLGVPTFSAGLSIVCLAYFDSGYLGVVLSMSIGYLFGICSAIYFLRKVYVFSFDFGLLLRILSFSWPLVFSSVSVWIIQFFDRIMISSMMSVFDMGIYAMAFKIASIAALASLGFQAAVAPLVYKYYREPETPVALGNAFHFYIVSGCILWLFMSVSADQLVYLLSSDDYSEASNLVPILTASVLISSLIVFAPGISLSKKTFFTFLIFSFGSGLCLFLNYIFIPQYGLLGAAWSTLSAHLAVSVSYIVVSQFFYRVRIMFFNSLLQIGVALLVFVVFVYFDVSSFLWVFAGFSASFVFAATLIFLRLFSFSEFRHFFAVIFR